MLSDLLCWCRSNGFHDAEDDPDRLYYSRGLGGLDSGEDSGDNESNLGDGDILDWGDPVSAHPYLGRN